MLRNCTLLFRVIRPGERFRHAGMPSTRVGHVPGMGWACARPALDMGWAWVGHGLGMGWAWVSHASDMRVDMREDMRVDMHVDMCVDMRVDMAWREACLVVFLTTASQH